MSTRHLLSTFLALPVRDKLTFLAAAVLLPSVRPAMRLVGFRRLRAVAVGPGGGRRDESAVLKARQLSRLVRQAARHTLGQPQCLERSLVLCRLLRHRGIERILHLGVEGDGPIVLGPCLGRVRQSASR